MNEKSVESLAALLKVTPSVIEKTLSEGGLDSVIDKYQSGVEIFTPDELAKKLKNHADDTIANLGSNGEDLPTHIYNRAKGNAFEAVEKKLAKANSITDFDGLEDLVSKIANKQIVESGKATGEKDDKIKELKSIIKKSDEKFETDKLELLKKFDNEIIGIAVKDGVGLVPLDGDNDKFLENQSNILKTMFMANHIVERKEGLIVVSDKGGNLIKDKVGDPVPLNDVITAYAPEWVKVKSDPEGGRGASSTEQGNTGLSGVKSEDDLESYIDNLGIDPASAEALDIRLTHMESQ